MSKARNPRYSSPFAQCRSHTASPDLLMIRPPSIRLVLDHPWSSIASLLLLPRSSSLPNVPHLSPTHHVTSKHVSPHQTDSRVEPPKFSGFKFKPRQVNYSSQIKPRYCLLDFSISPLISTLTTQRHKVWILNLRPHEAQLEDQKPKKSSRRSSRRRKNRKTNKWQEKRQTKEKHKERLKLKTPLITLNASSLPKVEFIMFLLSISWLAKEFYQLCAHSLPLWQWIHQIQTERSMRSKLWCFKGYTNRNLRNCTQPLCQDLQKQELILTKRPLIDNKHVAKS
jgi:hypothetical protein